jgi:hypothetical protein
MPVIRKFHGLNIYHFTGERDVTIALEKPPARVIPQAAIDQQNKFIEEFLDWLRFVPDKMRVLTGYAGTGKTHTIKRALVQAKDMGLLNGAVYACAPTHQAKGELVKSLKGAPIDGVSTAHSLLNLRPKTVKFLPHDEERLGTLLQIPKASRTDDEERIIDWLQIKQNKAVEGVQEFVSEGSLKKLDGVRLIVVDEGGMNNAYMFGLFCGLINCSDPDTNFHPDLQILFMGDPAQLPPIGESISKVFTLPSFTELTEVVRYTGAIKDYCNGVRDRSNPNYDRLHRMIGEDETLMCLPSYEILREDVLKEIYAEESIRFIASTNKRVADLNYMIRSMLKGKAGNRLFYESGDSILTLNGIAHDVSGSYGIACGAKGEKVKLEINTSTLIELGDPVMPGEVVETGGGDSTFMTNLSYEYTSPLGTKFERLIYRYRLYASGDPFSETKAICLINPEQFAAWKAECNQLLKRARSTQSRGKTEATARGQEGDTAKDVWKEYGLKSWFKRLDGSKVEAWEYKGIKSRLWQDYYNLYQFADDASYSYVSTCHRAQGATVDVIVIDMEDILGTSRAAWKKPGEDELWDTRKLLYTAASRAAKQLVFMI